MFCEVYVADKITVQENKNSFNTTNPTFSIILPVYNVEKYIVKCLKSIENQTYSNFEVILVDDGSTDNSVEKIMQFANQDARFNVVSQQNLGAGVARNNALKQAKGQYIVFVDPDDWIETQALEKLLGAFSSANAEVIEFNYNECNDLSGEIKLHDNALLMKKRFSRDLSYSKYYNLSVIKEKCFWGVDIHIWTRAYSAEFLHRINAKFSALRLAEDHIFLYMVLLNADKIYYINDCLYNYRCRFGSLVNETSNNNFCAFKAAAILKEYLKSQNLYDEFKNVFREYQLLLFAECYQRLPKESIRKYKKVCRKVLPICDYLRMRFKTKTYKSFLEMLFSIKNERRLGIKRKVINILGISIRI